MVRFVSKTAKPFSSSKNPISGGCKIASEIGTEELAHLEMVGTIIHQLTRCLTDEQIKKAGFEPYFVDHGNGVYPQAAAGFPWTAATIQSKGDIITDLHEDMAADAAIA